MNKGSVALRSIDYSYNLTMTPRAACNTGTKSAHTKFIQREQPWILTKEQKKQKSQCRKFALNQ